MHLNREAEMLYSTSLSRVVCTASCRSTTSTVLPAPQCKGWPSNSNPARQALLRIGPERRPSPSNSSELVGCALARRVSRDVLTNPTRCRYVMLEKRTFYSVLDSTLSP